MQKRTHRKAQISTEYILTYGWAILSILIVVFILYSGEYFNLDRYLPSYCSFLPDFPCHDFKIVARADEPTGYLIAVRASNGLGGKICIREVNVTGDGLYGASVLRRDAAKENLTSISVGVGNNVPLIQSPVGIKVLDGENVTMVLKTEQNGRLKPVGRPIRLYLSITYLNCGAIGARCGDQCEHVNDPANGPYLHTIVGLLRTTVGEE